MQLGLALDEAFPGRPCAFAPHIIGSQVCAAMLVPLTGVYCYAGAAMLVTLTGVCCYVL